jgi:hypothetical protein
MKENSKNSPPDEAKSVVNHAPTFDLEILRDSSIQKARSLIRTHRFDRFNDVLKRQLDGSSPTPETIEKIATQFVLRKFSLVLLVALIICCIVFVLPINSWFSYSMIWIPICSGFSIYWIDLNLRLLIPDKRHKARFWPYLVFAVSVFVGNAIACRFYQFPNPVLVFLWITGTVLCGWALLSQFKPRKMSPKTRAFFFFRYNVSCVQIIYLCNYCSNTRNGCFASSLRCYSFVFPPYTFGPFQH